MTPTRDRLLRCPSAKWGSLHKTCSNRNQFFRLCFCFLFEICFLIVKVSSSIVMRDFDLFLALLVVTLKNFFELKFIDSGQVGQNLNEKFAIFFFFAKCQNYWTKLVHVFKMTRARIFQNSSGEKIEHVKSQHRSKLNH